AASGCRCGKDRRRGVRDVDSCGSWVPDGADGTDRITGGAALGDDRSVAVEKPSSPPVIDGEPDPRRAARGALGNCERRRRSGGGYAVRDSEGRAFSEFGTRRDRRAAQVRRQTASANFGERE